jgi:hypothetical protein
MIFNILININNKIQTHLSSKIHKENKISDISKNLLVKFNYKNEGKISKSSN